MSQVLDADYYTFIPDSNKNTSDTLRWVSFVTFNDENTNLTFDVHDLGEVVRWRQAFILVPVHVAPDQLPQNVILGLSIHCEQTDKGQNHIINDFHQYLKFRPGTGVELFPIEENKDISMMRLNLGAMSDYLTRLNCAMGLSMRVSIQFSPKIRSISGLYARLYTPSYTLPEEKCVCQVNRVSYDNIYYMPVPIKAGQFFQKIITKLVRDPQALHITPIRNIQDLKVFVNGESVPISALTPKDEARDGQTIALSSDLKNSSIYIEGKSAVDGTLFCFVTYRCHQDGVMQPF